MGQDRPDGIEYPAGIHRQHLRPLLVGHVLEEHPRQADAGVADQGVQVVNVGKDLIHHGAHLGGVGHVPVDRERPVADLVTEGEGGVLGLKIVDGDLITAGGKTTGGLRPDAPAGAGDEYRLRHNIHAPLSSWL